MNPTAAILSSAEPLAISATAPPFRSEPQLGLSKVGPTRVREMGSVQAVPGWAGTRGFLGLFCSLGKGFLRGWEGCLLHKPGAEIWMPAANYCPFIGNTQVNWEIKTRLHNESCCGILPCLDILSIAWSQYIKLWELSTSYQLVVGCTPINQLTIVSPCLSRALWSIVWRVTQYPSIG